MAEIIARFADGRLLVQEEKLVESRYCGSGVFVAVGHLRKVEKVLSIDTDYIDEGLITPLREARPSTDGVYVMMRRGDVGTPVLTGALIITSGLLSGVASGIQGPLSGLPSTVTLTGPIHSGALALGVMSGLTSGLAWRGEVVSGNINVSGHVRVFLNVIGY